MTQGQTPSAMKCPEVDSPRPSFRTARGVPVIHIRTHIRSAMTLYDVLWSERLLARPGCQLIQVLQSGAGGNNLVGTELPLTGMRFQKHRRGRSDVARMCRGRDRQRPAHVGRYQLDQGERVLELWVVPGVLNRHRRSLRAHAHLRRLRAASAANLSEGGFTSPSSTLGPTGSPSAARAPTAHQTRHQCVGQDDWT